MKNVDISGNLNNTIERLINEAYSHVGDQQYLLISLFTSLPFYEQEKFLELLTEHNLSSYSDNSVVVALIELNKIFTGDHELLTDYTNEEGAQSARENLLKSYNSMIDSLALHIHTKDAELAGDIHYFDEPFDE